MQSAPQSIEIDTSGTRRTDGPNMHITLRCPVGVDCVRNYELGGVPPESIWYVTTANNVGGHYLLSATGRIEPNSCTVST